MKFKYLFLVLSVSMLLASTATAQSTVTLSSSTGEVTLTDGQTLTGTGGADTRVTIADGASITLNNATISGGIVCEGSATITLVGTNSVSGATNKAGIQIGGSGTTLTIKGDGSLTANGGEWGAGIGLSAIFNYDNNVSSGDITIEGGTITAIGGNQGAGIGIGIIKNTKNDNSTSVQFGNVTIKGGTVTATDGGSGDGIGKGYSYPGPSITFGIVTIYDGINMVDASSIKNSESIVYMHDETDVTANASTYFTIIEDGDRRIIEKKDNTDYSITIADGIEHGSIAYAATTAKYGEKITITATPNFGYRLSRLVVKDAQNNDVASTGNSFFMPKSNLTISAVFEQGTHGTTEFTWVDDPGDGPESIVEKTIYNGVTTENLQQGRNYRIRTAYYKYLVIDNDEYNVSIPYSGGTGTFENVGTNFALRYATAGFYDITMTDAGNGKWNVSILKTAGQMDVVPDQTYTGSEIKPEPLVMAGSLNITKGTDYEYSYTNNTNAGTATVRATFKGTYASLGYVEKTFTINPRVTISGALTLTEYGNRTTAEIQGDFTTSSEGKSLDISTPIPVNKVIFKRSFTKGIPATIMLPFGFTPDGDNIGSFYTLKSVECKNGEWIATMSDPVIYVEANKPYIFKSAVEELNEMSFEDENKDDDEVGITLQPTSDIKENPNGDWTLHGVYEKTMLYGNGQINYGFAGKDVKDDGIGVGDFIRAGEGVWADPMRCYLTYKNGELTTKAATVLPDRIRVVFPDEENSNNETTDIIENTETEDVVTPVSEFTPESSVKVWSFGGTLYIEAQPDMDYTIVDLTGRTIKKGVTHSTHEEVTLNAKGIVIVKIGNKSFKIK